MIILPLVCNFVDTSRKFLALSVRSATRDNNGQLISKHSECTNLHSSQQVTQSRGLHKPVYILLPFIKTLVWLLSEIFRQSTIQSIRNKYSYPQTSTVYTNIHHCLYKHSFMQWVNCQLSSEQTCPKLGVTSHESNPSALPTGPLRFTIKWSQ